MKHRVTLRDIAAEMGLSVQAVSLALRGCAGVSEATREQVKFRASELGYVPDPGLRALADYRTRGHQAATRWNRVALVHNWPTEHALYENRFYAKWYRHLESDASGRGIRIETHWLGTDLERTDTVFRTLRNRGITGVFVAPPAMTSTPTAIQLPCDQFQVVTFGPGHLYPDFHTVQFDFYENLRLAWRILSERGCKRIGLIYAEDQGWRTGHAWRAAFHVENLLSGGPPGERMPLEVHDINNSSHSRYLRWLREGDYDGVISSVHWIDGLHIPDRPPPKIALFNVDHPGQQGIDLNLPQMAQTAMELLTLEMQRSMVKERSLPFRVHIPGRWVD